MNPETASSPPWGSTAKGLVALVGTVLAGLLLIRFQRIIPPLVVAGIATYLLLPVIRWVHERTRLGWRLATSLLFILLVLALSAGLTAAGLVVVQQLQGLFLTIQALLFDLPAQIAAWSQETIRIGPIQVDLAQFELMPLVEQALAAIQPLLGQASGVLTSVATGALETLANLVFILAVAYFLAVDFERIRSAWARLAIPGLGDDIARLRQALERIWNAFLRGQLLIVASTGVMTWILMTALGVRFAIGLGVLGGLAKFVPILGPVSAGALAALITLFQPGNWLGLSPVQHGLVIILAVFVLDQSIDYLLIPRIMGSALNVHPVLVLIGAIVGASLAGVIGLLLSAPAMATLLLLGRYAYRKLVDLSPWDPPIDAGPPQRAAAPPWRWLRHGLPRLRRRERSPEPRQDAGREPE